MGVKDLLREKFTSLFKSVWGRPDWTTAIRKTLCVTAPRLRHTFYCMCLRMSSGLCNSRKFACSRVTTDEKAFWAGHGNHEIGW